MSIAEMLLPEFEQEIAGTRKCLERLPDNILDWKAHPKSNPIRWVGSHLAEIVGWVEGTLTQPSWDFSPPDQPPYEPPMYASHQVMVEELDKNAAAALRAIADCSDAEFSRPFTLLYQGNELFTLPKLAVIRSFVISHMIHHRAILTVYMRLNDVPVPALYGPSGDEDS